MLASFYIFAMFAPSGYVLEKDYLVLLIFLLPLLGLALITLFGNKTLRLRLEGTDKDVSVPLSPKVNRGDLQMVALFARGNRC
jgi:hypothetical protein